MKPPSDFGLPYTAWRTGQQLAIRTAQYPKTPHVVIQAPTGSGKSLIAAALTRMDERRRVILTATKGLMDQYGGLFPFLYDIRGMSNYECLAARDEFRKTFALRRGPVMCDDGPCHGGARCTLKDNGCLYFDRYRSALGHRTPLTNYAFWLAIRRYGKGLGIADPICDEAHALPEQLMSACGLDIAKSLFTSPPPTTRAGWREWAELQIHTLAPGSDDDTRVRRNKTVETLKVLARIDDTWEWDEGDRSFRFEPVVPRLLLPLLHTFDRASTVVYLSATITPHTLKLLAINPTDVTFHAMRSTFPVERGPVYLCPGARNDYRTSEADLGELYAAMWDFAEPRLGRNGIIHTVSYQRARQIYGAAPPDIRRRMVLHKGSDDLPHAVEGYRQTPGAILVSPSVMTGWDFPGRDCEWQMLPKVPFPNTQSRIMKARIAATEGYRDHLTMQNLVQACGRGNRYEQDSCETAIFDENAKWFLRKFSDLAPQSFLDRVVTTRRAHITPLPKLVKPTE